MEADSSVAIVFRCFEEFLRKAGTMDVFDTLVYNYRLKDEFLSSEKVEAFSLILDELIQKLAHLRKEIDKMKQLIEFDVKPFITFSAPVSNKSLTQPTESSNPNPIMTFPVTPDNVIYTNGTLDANFINMVTLGNASNYHLESGDQKNTTYSVVVSDLQTLFSTGLDSVNQSVSQEAGSTTHISTIIPQVSSNNDTQAAGETNCANQNVGTPEVFLIPILKETFKTEEELSVDNICSMLTSNFESTTSPEDVIVQPVEPTPPKTQKVSTKMVSSRFKKPKFKVNSARPVADNSVGNTKAVGAAFPFNKTTNEISSKEESPLLFHCCDKCFHSYRNQEKFSVHKCTNSKTGSEKNSPVFVKSNSGLRSMKKFVCGLCLEEYRNLDRITFHLKRCEGGPFSCENCPSSAPQFPTMKSLNLHRQQQHKEVRKFVCKDCGFPFKFKCSLQKHKLRAHNTDLEPRTFPCDLCPSVFMKKIFLTNHKLKNHSLERHVLCHICGKSFSAQQNLKTHLEEEHLESNQFPCTDCDKVFTRKEQLGFHMIIHSGVGKAHVCETCGKSFSKKCKLDDHFERRHASGVGKNFPCTFSTCTKVFKTKKDQRCHFRRMHSENSDEKLGKNGNEENKDGKGNSTSTGEKDNPLLLVRANGESSQNHDDASVQKLEIKVENEVEIMDMKSDQSAPTQNHISMNPASCSELSNQEQDTDDAVISDIMNALTPGQFDQILGV